MRKLFLLNLIGCLALGQLQAQKGSVSGFAYDTIAKQRVSGATVSVLARKDSSLVSFTMTGSDGRFALNGLPNGDYRLLITHVNYHNSNTYFSLSDSLRDRDLGSVTMNDKNKVLAEVVIRSEAPPITLINDTIQYNAGSFKVQPNASVEQLLKKLPGVQVDRDGTIKAQGEKVNRVLVDGKEFFGNDPKIATRNLPADAVDKVQVYDRQSEQAQLTGFEDGNYEKTINLKLKKDKKKGTFGKVTGGAGTRDRYEGKFNVNSFKGARQLSAIGMANNTNAEGFSFMDILNFSGELARMQRGGNGGNINISLSADQAAAMGMNPAGRNSGITTAWGGGINYNNIIGSKTDWQSNYFYNRYNPRQESNLERQYFLPDSSYFYNQHSVSDNRSENHRLNLNVLFQLDSLNSIRVTPSFNLQQTDNRSQSGYQTLTEEKRLTNEGFSNTRSESRGSTFRNEIIWRKKFAKRGRTFSLSLQTSLNQSSGNGSLSSVNSFYNTNSGLLKKDTLDQRNETEANLRGYTARAVYTEPLFKRSLLEFSLSNSLTKNSSLRQTWDYDKLSGKYANLNSLLSNNFKNTYGYRNAGLRLRTQKKKYNYAMGLSWQQAELEGRIISGNKDSVIGKTFCNWLPNARFQYNFSKFRTLSLTYNTSTNQPSVSQLQPVPDNSNPLNIREGNPGLKQEFSHALQANLNLLSPYKNRNLFFFITFQSTRNRIVNYDTLTALGVKVSRPVNVNGVYNLNSNISYSLPVRWLKGSFEVRANTGLSRNKQFINGKGNTINTVSIGPALRLDMNPTEKINWTLEASMGLNRSGYSLQPAQDAKYLSQEYSTSVDWQLPKQYFFSTEFTYSVNSQRAAGFNLRVPLWNASISKQFLKYNRGELKLGVNDLLNRNVGISRNTNNNYIEDSRVLTLRRFFLLSFTYSLTKSGLGTGGGAGNMRVITR